MSELWSASSARRFRASGRAQRLLRRRARLPVPKVAISRAIADLEKSIGVQLMKRTTRRIFLTAAGEAVLPHARAIGVEVEKVRQLAQTFSTSREGPLRVIADPTYGRVLLAPLVPRFLDSFPDIALDVVLDAGRRRGMGRGDSCRRERRPEARRTTAGRAARGARARRLPTCRSIRRPIVPKACATTRCSRRRVKAPNTASR